tara:strand:+ start:686 stop:1123 length:438 start_codon:yes stop_codon:yes gene_type:complete
MNNRTSIHDLLDLDEENDTYEKYKSKDVKKNAQNIQHERNMEKYASKIKTLEKKEEPSITVIDDYATGDNTHNIPHCCRDSNGNFDISECIKNSYAIASYLKEHKPEAYKTASSFYEADNTIFYVIIGILIIICLLLGKKAMYNK